jgi:hypothetical protein
LTNSMLSGSAAISNANLATMASSSTSVGTVKGNISGSSATPSDLVLSAAATASTVSYRDSSANLYADNHVDGYATSATGGGTVTLTVDSVKTQFFTGTTNTVKMPAANTLTLGHQFFLKNDGSGALTVQDNSAGSITSIAAGGYGTVTVTNIGSASGTWSAAYTSPSGSGTVTSVAATVPSGLSISGSPITTSGTLAISANGAFGMGGVTTVSGAGTTTLTSSDYGKVYLVTTSGARTFNLPTRSTAAVFHIKDASGGANSYNITLHRVASEQIEGVASDYTISTQWWSGTIVCDGTNWFILK